MTSPQDPFTPPGDGSTPGDGQPGLPQYGQQPPQYGQQPPQYGQPQYGQPQYGQPPYGQPYQQQGGTNGLAIGALVAAFLCSPLGIILGFVARNQIKQRGQAGAGLALAAIIVGFVSLALGIIVFAIGAASSPSTTY